MFGKCSECVYCRAKNHDTAKRTIAIYDENVHKYTEDVYAVWDKYKEPALRLRDICTYRAGRKVSDYSKEELAEMTNIIRLLHDNLETYIAPVRFRALEYELENVKTSKRPISRKFAEDFDAWRICDDITEEYHIRNLPQMPNLYCMRAYSCDGFPTISKGDIESGFGCGSWEKDNG